MLSLGEVVVARRKMKIFTYSMIDQLHKRSIFGPLARQPVRLSFFTTLRRQNFIHILFSPPQYRGFSRKEWATAQECFAKTLGK
jgi:hypothetical protein